MKGGEIMKLDLNKFYNSNYKDFVHKEALEEALRMVAEVDLKDVEIDTILSITFSVDEFGENPIYVEYLDKDGKKHIVRIRPAVSNEIQEILNRYVTLEQHETDKNAIYNHFERLNVPLELRSANGLDEEGNREVILNNDNSFISFQVDPEQDDAIQRLCIQNKGGLGAQTQYVVRFDDFAKQNQLNSLNELVQELATNVNGSQIGERTKINFELTNSHNEEATNPTITKNESYYVQVGSQYIVSVYLTFNVDVAPTSKKKSLAFAWVHDIPAENPPLTLTVVMESNKSKYTSTMGISTNRNRVVFFIPAFPADEIYESTEITIYGSAITKDLTKESE